MSGFLSDYIFESFGIRKSLILTVFQQMADLDTSQIWFHKWCENIWVTGKEDDWIKCFLSVGIYVILDINLHWNLSSCRSEFRPDKMHFSLPIFFSPKTLWTSIKLILQRKNRYAIIRFKMKQDLGPGECFKQFKVSCLGIIYGSLCSFQKI